MKKKLYFNLLGGKLNCALVVMIFNLLLCGNIAIAQNELYTVPLVVHIIYTDSVGTNISDNQVFSAIDALNDDFRKKSGTQGYGAGIDTEIEFCLAERDPNGNPTNGITRYYCAGSCAEDYDSLGFDPAINELDVKLLDIWPKEQYYEDEVIIDSKKIIKL